LVQFKNVSRIHENGVSSIKDVDFVINEGEFVFLIGPSGSGKTTIIELLIRDQRPTEGKIFFNDVDITDISRGSVYKLRRQIGVIFQDFKLIPDKTAFENVAFAMEAAGKSNKEIKETVPYVLDIVGLGHRMDAFPKQLSGGEQQRVAIARAISNNPKLLIADEPTGNLDPASAWDIVQILTKINNWGTTVIMSTHGTDIVNTLNKRVIQLEEGLVLRDDNEGQYEFSEKVSKKQIEEILIQSSDVSVEKPKSRFKLKLGKDLKVDKSEVVNERASEPGMKTENRKQKSESEPELGDVSQEAENSENRHITDNRSSITKEDKKSKKKV
jgi:cell division transport system ATP-binding protein